MDFAGAPIIDSHTHWGHSLSMGSTVTTGELLAQQQESGVTNVILIPFPSTAIDSNEVNVKVLEEAGKVSSFIPYFYIREDFPRIPDEYYGGKWHWMRGIQDAASNYRVLDDRELPDLIRDLTDIGKPIVFEEEFAFTERFVDMAPGLPLIIPHLGMLGGNPTDFLKAFRDKTYIYFDTALAAKNTIQKFVETVGPERLLFAADVPFGNMTSELSKVLTLTISDSDKELILSKNIIRLTKLTALHSCSPCGNP
ncbi:MAG TPA: amidohydrolase family protein [Syntrophorhabdales bacterium]|nr:amidohydrolase family protein [Syntrophorhabdales bacterium]